MYCSENDGSSGENDFILDSETLTLVMMVLYFAPRCYLQFGFAPLYILFIIIVGFDDFLQFEVYEIYILRTFSHGTKTKLFKCFGAIEENFLDYGWILLLEVLSNCGSSIMQVLLTVSPTFYEMKHLNKPF